MLSEFLQIQAKQKMHRGCHYPNFSQEVKPNAFKTTGRWEEWRLWCYPILVLTFKCTIVHVSV